jgi:hypothetical protein
MSHTEGCDSKPLNQIQMDIDGNWEVTHVDHSSDFSVMYGVCLLSSANLTTHRIVCVAAAVLCKVGVDGLNFGMKELNPIRRVDIRQRFSVFYVLCRLQPCGGSNHGKPVAQKV